MEADWWPAIAASMPRPWPEEAVLMDLRWWRGQEVATKRKLMPARRALQERWGWKEWDARMILRRESVWEHCIRIAGCALLKGQWLVRFLDTGEIKVYSNEAFQLRFEVVT